MTVLVTGLVRRIFNETGLFHLSAFCNRLCDHCFGNRIGQNVFIRMSSGRRISRKMAARSVYLSTGEQSLRGPLPTAADTEPMRSLRVRDRLSIRKASLPRLYVRGLSVPAVSVSQAPAQKALPKSPAGLAPTHSPLRMMI